MKFIFGPDALEVRIGNAESEVGSCSPDTSASCIVAKTLSSDLTSQTSSSCNCCGAHDSFVMNSDECDMARLMTLVQSVSAIPSACNFQVVRDEDSYLCEPDRILCPDLIVGNVSGCKILSAVI